MSVIPLSREEIDLIRRHGLSFAQIKWRREKIRDLGQRFRQEYPENEVDCFLASARGVFDQVALHKAVARIAAQPAPASPAVIKHGAGEIAVAPAQLRVWAAPAAKQVYVIGADIGEGLPDGDASAAAVIERSSGAQVAELHGRVPPDRFGRLLDALGRWYNGALLAVERNNHGHSTLNTLRNVCQYPNLYYHVRYDPVGKTTPVLGWPTDQATKPILVDDLATAIADGSLVIASSALADECFSFVSSADGGSQGAAEGAHDDRVIAIGIAWQARKRAVARFSSQRPAGW
jgi:hypothetical protein